MRLGVKNIDEKINEGTDQCCLSATDGYLDRRTKNISVRRAFILSE